MRLNPLRDNLNEVGHTTEIGKSQDVFDRARQSAGLAGASAMPQAIQRLLAPSGASS